MASRSLNKAQLIGNLTRDPELRYTPQGTAVCTFGLATNRSWITESGEKKEDAEFHRVVAWNKLAELCSQFLFKGRRVYVEGRLQTRQWTSQDGTPRQATEIVIGEMIMLDSRRAVSGGISGGVSRVASVVPSDTSQKKEGKKKEEKNGEKLENKGKKEENKKEGEITEDEIPF